MKKYKVVITTGERINGHVYSSARAAVKTYNSIIALFTRLGYKYADAGKGLNSRAALYIKDGFKDRNIEIYAVLYK